MITYGHEEYIRDAIEGVLMQECDFEVELILANDCSPDQTDNIIQDIIKNHPKGCWIKYIRHESNIGMMPNFIFALKECKGKYIALCEGDDYWTDPLKLQKQVSILETSQDYVLCFHQVSILKTNGEVVDDFITKVPQDYEIIETLARLGNYIHTPSVVFRNIINEFPLEFEYTPIGDYFLYMMLAEHGRLKFLEEKMAVYRFGVGLHSTNSILKKSKSDFKLFALLLSYSNNQFINTILLERQLGSFEYIESILKNRYKSAIIFSPFLFKVLNLIKHPGSLWKNRKIQFFR